MYKNPIPTVDAVILLLDHEAKIVLVKRKNPPEGWALPGGFVNEGESFEQAVVREAKEETGLDIEVKKQFHTYSDPQRDPRQHNTTTVYLAVANGTPKAADDAAEVAIVKFSEAINDYQLAFDHKKILQDVVMYSVSGITP